MNKCCPIALLWTFVLRQQYQSVAIMFDVWLWLCVEWFHHCWEWNWNIWFLNFWKKSRTHSFQRWLKIKRIKHFKVLQLSKDHTKTQCKEKSKRKKCRRIYSLYNQLSNLIHHHVLLWSYIKQRTNCLVVNDEISGKRRELMQNFRVVLLILLPSMRKERIQNAKGNWSILIQKFLRLVL